MKNGKSKILIILICLTLAFIWGNSILTIEASQKISDSIVAMLQKSGLYMQDNFETASTYVRKFAHFGEHFVLGALFLPLFREKNIKPALPYLLLVGITVPFIDETIQVFSGRGPMISDMWIDLAGFWCGIIIVYTIIKILEKAQQNKRRML